VASALRKFRFDRLRGDSCAAMTPKPKPKPKPWEQNLFWGLTGIVIGIELTVVATILRNIRPLLWIAFVVSFGPATMLITRFVPSWPRRVLALVLTQLILFLVIRWQYSYVPPEPSMSMEATIRRTGILGLHAELVAGECQGGTPEVSQKVQWIWFLSGSHFDCESNAYKSRATIRFEPGAFESVDTHAEDLFYHGEPIHAGIKWYATRGDGNVKWVLSAVCADMRKIGALEYQDVLTFSDSPVATGRGFQKTSEGTFQVPGKCDDSGGIFLRLSRRGDEKDDTLQAPAYVTGLQIDSTGPRGAFGN
jgi:hypothetical protein